MNNGWQTKRIDEVAVIKPPKSEARARVASEALVSFVPMEDLRIEKKYPRAIQTRRLSDVVGSYTYFAEGDVLLAKITPCFENGKLGIAKGLKNGIGFGSSEFIVLRPDRTITKDWLYYFLSREDFRTEGAQRMGGAVGQQRVPKEFVESYQIPVPPLSDQQRIVDLLDESFADLATAKANAEKNLHNARALFESHLQSVFSQRGEGWVEKSLAELCESDRIITYGVVQLGSEVPGGVPCLRTSNVRWLRIETDVMKRIAPKLSASYSRTVLRGGEVLVNVRGTLGGVGVASEAMKGWNISREVAVAPVDSRVVDPRFVAFSIGGGASQGWLGRMKKGAAYVGINIEDLRNLPVRVPVLEKQIEIISRLEFFQAETQRLESLYQQKLAALEALKKSLLHQAFTGNL